MGKIKDLTGKRFGRLIVLELADDIVSPSGRTAKQWLCQCDCGNRTIVRAESLNSGRCKSCGCLRRDILSQTKSDDLTNRRFGKLVATERVGSSQHSVLWLCKCDCGNTVIVKSCNLVSGDTKSCGCLRLEKIQAVHIKHGDGCRNNRARLYNIWKAMRQRCSNPNQAEYHRYGGRGIKVCSEWSDYLTFKVWALANGYADGLSIDRIDNDGDYCPENCKWSTQKEQGRNTSQNRNVTINGVTMSLTAWCESAGISRATVGNRIYTLGWSDIEAITTPVGEKRVQNGSSRDSPASEN